MTMTRTQELHLFDLADIARVDRSHGRCAWHVASRSQAEPRLVTWRRNPDGSERWTCSCPAWRSGRRCAHVYSVRWWGEYRREYGRLQQLTDAKLEAEDRQMTRWVAAARRGDLILPDGWECSWLALSDVVAERAALGVA